jgi:hypothetical protein
LFTTIWSSEEDLKDKSAIVTGAASGIGKEIALNFAREGAKVAIADLNKAASDAPRRRRSGASCERVMPSGTILNFDPHRAFGFIRPDAGPQNIYYHLRSYPQAKFLKSAPASSMTSHQMRGPNVRRRDAGVE